MVDKIIMKKLRQESETDFACRFVREKHSMSMFPNSFTLSVDFKCIFSVSIILISANNCNNVLFIVFTIK